VLSVIAARLNRPEVRDALLAAPDEAQAVAAFLGGRYERLHESQLKTGRLLTAAHDPSLPTWQVQVTPGDGRQQRRNELNHLLLNGFNQKQGVCEARHAESVGAGSLPWPSRSLPISLWNSAMRTDRLLVLPVMMLLAAAMTAAEVVPAPYRLPAEVAVTTTVAAPNPGGWTATFENPPIENLLAGGEYEPFNFRYRLYANGEGVDSIPLSESEATGYDCRREGFFDGATARVYRIVNGTMVNVRRDTVTRHRASGWSATESKLVPADKPTIQWNFEGWNAPDAQYRFAVVAVGTDGTWSKPSNVIMMKRPVTCEDKSKNDHLFAFAWPEGGGGPGTISGKQPPAPTNLAFVEHKGCLDFTWDPVKAPGVAGYQLVRSDYAPDKHLGYGFDLAGKAASPEQHIKKGDLVFLDLRRTDWSRKKYTANRVWDDWGNGGIANIFPGHQDESSNHTWTLVPHPTPIPPGFTAADRGQTCLKISMTGAEQVGLKQYNHAGPSQNWYPVLTVGRPYAVEFWAREEGMANANVHFGFSSVYEGSLKHDFTLTGEWKKYVCEFTPDQAWPKENEAVGEMKLSFTGPGTLWLDMGVPQADIDDLRASGMGFLRTHAFIKSGWSYFLDDLTNAPGVIGRRGNVDDGAPSTLFSILGFLKQAKVNPWLQIEMSLAEDEWQGLVEYLAAPYDPAKDSPKTKPWAAKRFAMGQAKPWSDEFPRFLFEVSNETWNPHPGFAPWHFPWQKMTDGATGRVYEGGELTGLMTGYILSQMKKSPYWANLAPKMETVGCGWLVQLDDDGFGQKMARQCPDIRHVLVANYNGGWDEGASAATADDAGRRLALTVCPQYSQGSMEKFAETRERLAAQGVKYKIGTYEAGPGYSLPNTITNEQVEAESQVMKSLAAGTGTLDCFLDGAQQGLVLQNFFTYSRGRNYWTSHALPRNGGQAYPSWRALSMYNRLAQGDFLATQPISVPTDALAKTATRAAMAAAPLTGVYATRQGDRYSVFVLSRKLDSYPYAGDDGYTPVTLRLPFTAAKKITLHQMSGDPRATNLDADNVKVVTSDIPVARFAPKFTLDADRGADRRGLPPGSIFLYVFEGTTTPPLAKQVAGTVTPALGQATTTSVPVLRFQVSFDRAVSRFTADQVVVAGTAGGNIAVEWPIRWAGTGCIITIADVIASGTVGFTIPAGVVKDAAGTTNAVIASPLLTYAIPAPKDLVMVQETFDPVDGKRIWASSGGRGWKGLWTLHNEDPAKFPEGYVLSAERPLTYPSVAASPSYLRAGLDSLSLWRDLDVDGSLAFAKRITKEEGPAQVGLSGTSVWLSFLVRKDKLDRDQLLLSLNSEAFYKEEHVAARFGCDAGSMKDDKPFWALHVRNPDNNGWTIIPTTTAVEAGKSVLMVARVSFAQTDAVELYVDPPLGGKAPDKPSAAYVAGKDRKLIFNSLVLWGGRPDSGAFDEIRIGDSFKAVTPGR